MIKKTEMTNDKEMNGISRRSFIRKTAFAGAGIMLSSTGLFGASKPAMAAADNSVVDEIFRQAIDFHLHNGPDIIPRKVDDIGLCKLYMETGLTGFVLKSHHTCTAERVYMLRKMFPKLETYGAIALNRVFGGMNVRALEMFSKLEGNHLRMVWFPTQDAENDEKTKYSEAVKIFDDGKLTKETREVIKFCANKKLILNTGHLHTQEAFHVAEAAREMGVERVVCTHVTNANTRMSVENQKKIAKMGGYLEYNWLQIHYYKEDPKSPKGLSPQVAADWIKEVGADHIIFDTDFGQANNPSSPEGMRALITEMLNLGISKADLIKMTSTNPYKLLRL